MSPSPRMYLSKRCCTMSDSWPYGSWFHGGEAGSKLVKSQSGDQLGQGPVWAISIMTKSQSHSSVMHMPLHLIPFQLARGCLLHVLKEDRPLTRFLVSLASQHVSSLNGTWEENIWQSSPKPLIPIRVVRHRQWPGGTEHQAGLRLREVFSVGGIIVQCGCGVLADGWGEVALGTWRAGHGSAQEFLRQESASTEHLTHSFHFDRHCPFYVSTNKYENAYYPTPHYDRVLSFLNFANLIDEK